MRLRRTTRALAALLIAGGSGLIVLGGPVDAQTAVESGWWWKANAGQTVQTPVNAVPLPQPAPAPQLIPAGAEVIVPVPVLVTVSFQPAGSGAGRDMKSSNPPVLPPLPSTAMK